VLLLGERGLYELEAEQAKNDSHEDENAYMKGDERGIAPFQQNVPEKRQKVRERIAVGDRFKHLRHILGAPLSLLLAY